MKENDKFLTYVFVALFVLLVLYKCASMDATKNCEDLCNANNRSFSGSYKEDFTVTCYCSHEINRKSQNRMP